MIDVSTFIQTSGWGIMSSGIVQTVKKIFPGIKDGVAHLVSAASSFLPFFAYAFSQTHDWGSAAMQGAVAYFSSQATFAAGSSIAQAKKQT